MSKSAQAKVTRPQAAVAKKLGINTVDPPAGRPVDRVLDLIRRRYRITTGH